MKVTILQVKKWHKNAFFVHNSPCQIAESLRRVFLKLSWWVALKTFTPMPYSFLSGCYWQPLWASATLSCVWLAPNWTKWVGMGQHFTHMQDLSSSVQGDIKIRFCNQQQSHTSGVWKWMPSCKKTVVTPTVWGFTEDCLWSLWWGEWSVMLAGVTSISISTRETNLGTQFMLR